MNLLERMRHGYAENGHSCEQVVAVNDPSCELAGYLVIDHTARGPATGGIRLYPYASEDEALADGMRLARAMTFKNAAAELPVGGGKMVLFAPRKGDRKELLAAIGRVIESQAGRFLAGRDIGISVSDGLAIRTTTRFMVDESEQGVGDLNRATALGVLEGAKACLMLACGEESFRGTRVAIQGIGGVGSWLARMLHEQGADLLLADVAEASFEKLSGINFTRVDTDEILSVACDVLAPCAVGGVIHERSVESVKAKVVAGSANNILATPRAGERLFERGIVYAPDFLINAGAVIQGVRYLLNAERASIDAITEIGTKTLKLLKRSAKASLPPEKLLLRETKLRLEGPQTSAGWWLPTAKP